MTIREIFKRYDISEATAADILAQAAFVQNLHDNWVGPELDWRALVRSALFYDMGSEEVSATVRKKVGVDKYVVNILKRSVQKREREILVGHDIYYKIVLLSAYYRYGTHANEMKGLERQLEENTLEAPSKLCTTPSSAQREALLEIDIKHYKNPSI